MTLARREKIKVLFVINASSKPFGAEFVLLDYLRQISSEDSGVDPYVALFNGDESYAEMFSGVIPSDHVRFFRYKQWNSSRILRFFLMPIACRYNSYAAGKAIGLDGWLEKESFDCVYFNNSYEAATYFDAFKGIPRVVHIHDMIGNFRPAYRRSVVQAVQKADAVVTVSNACKNGLVDLGADERMITVAYNGVDFPCNPARSIDNEDNTLKIGFVGTTTRRKGFDLYCDAICQLAIRHAEFDIEPVIVTSYESDSYSDRNIEKLKTVAQPCVIRNISRDEVQEAYRAMDLLLVPSRNDPLPTVVLEATNAGIAVLGAGNDGIPEMINDPARIFEGSCAADITDCIEQWIDQPRWRQLESIGANQEYIECEFSNERKSAVIGEALFRLANGRAV